MSICRPAGSSHDRCRLRTRISNSTVSSSSQTPLIQSTASISTINPSSEYSSSSSELYQIITRSASRPQTTSFQQLTKDIGPLDSNMLDIGQNVLLSTQDNINFIHEIFRQVNRSVHLTITRSCLAELPDGRREWRSGVVDSQNSQRLG